MDALASELDSRGLPRALVVEVARHAIAISRDQGGDPRRTASDELDRLERLRPRPVINATGVLLHTNLGRAPLHPDAVEAAGRSSGSPSPVEFDLGAGRRGKRGAYTEELLRSITGSEAALVVNNNAGALLLALAALGAGREVVVSRGELIEIGGSFRLPDLMEASGAVIREVGTTNRTRLRDYRAAIGPATAALLKVHPSNYRIEGFTAAAGYAELADLAAGSQIPLIADVGSGLLDARVPWVEGPPPAWLQDEPAVRQTLESGATVVLFSGDKLLGGPQAGIAVGDQGAVDLMRHHPLARALRIAGPPLDALAATLEYYADGRAGELPFWRMAGTEATELHDRISRVLTDSGCEADVIEDRSLPGAGTVPGTGIPGPVLSVEGDAEAIWRRLLVHDPPVIARRDDRGVLIDLRSVPPEADVVVAAALRTACR